MCVVLGICEACGLPQCFRLAAAAGLGSRAQLFWVLMLHQRESFYKVSGFHYSMNITRPGKPEDRQKGEKRKDTLSLAYRPIASSSMTQCEPWWELNSEFPLFDTEPLKWVDFIPCFPYDTTVSAIVSYPSCCISDQCFTLFGVFGIHP